MLVRAETSALLIVDVQERLLPAIEDGERVLAELCVAGADVAGSGCRSLSEQYPQGLGTTGAALRDLVHRGIVEKVHFSCVAEGCLKDLPAYASEQIVVAGTEAHVCVLQTVLDLSEQGKQVFVVAEAVASRAPLDRELALARMRENGVQIVSREMVAFEWLGARAPTCSANQPRVPPLNRACGGADHRRSCWSNA